MGLILYTHYFLHFILAAMLLLVSMILVIVLTGLRNEYVKHQDLFDDRYDGHAHLRSNPQGGRTRLPREIHVRS